MNGPPHPNSIGNRYRNPRPYNNQWRPRGPHPHSGFQWRPNANFRPPTTNLQNVNKEEFWCETCDRGFPTTDILDKHKQQHQKCNIDGCQFVAHPKVITKHIQMQHSSGLFKKISKLDNPEEIQKWREERKKKYPTRINIEKKAAECKEKIERGEKMGLRRDRNDKHNTDHPTGTKRRHSFDKNSQNHKTNRHSLNQRHNQNNISNNKDHPLKKVPKIIPKVPSVVEKNKLKPFAGITSICKNDDDKEDVINLSDDNNTLIEDDYYEKPVQQPIERPVQEPILCGALSSLMCEYGSSDEEAVEKENKLYDNIRTSIPLRLNNDDKKNGDTVNDDNRTAVVETFETVNNVIKNNIISVNDIDLKTVVLPVIKTKVNHNVENSDDDSGPEEVKTVKINVEEPSYVQESTKNKKSIVSAKKNFTPRNNYRNNNNYKHKVPSTLLHKLLYKEIRQERNIVLQCIRYIKKMNYFEKITQ